MANLHHIEQQVKQIRQGNELAFETLFFTHYQPLCKYTWKYVRSMEEAKGIAQDVFADVWQNRASLDENKHIKGLLFTLAKNRALDTIKHQKMAEKYENETIAAQKGWLQASGELQFNRHTEGTFVDEDICRAIQELPPGARKIFKLNREGGLTYKEIAAFLEISVKTVESQMSRALQLLRKSLKHSSVSLVLFLSFIPFFLFY